MTARYHNDKPRRALFAGSFDPFTVGHASVVERGLELFDHVVIAVGVNAAKAADAAVATRLEAIRQLYAAADESVSVVAYRDTLTVDLARELDCHWLLRGVRSVKDFEYERDMAQANRLIGDLETVILFALPSQEAISSSLVRELAHYGREIGRAHV